MIPKFIHYCWFGRKPLPPLAKKCIKSWKKYLPDYEIKEWNENNFDVNIIPYTEEAYKAGKYAFVSDYARLWILYNYGGIYFDTDVELIKSPYNITINGAFMGREYLSAERIEEGVNPGLGLGMPIGHNLIKELLDIYSYLRFFKDDGTLNLTTIVTNTTNLFKAKHIDLNNKGIYSVENINIYPPDYFCPKDYFSGKITLTPNTVAIHHYDASWKTDKDKLKKMIINFLGKRLTKVVIWIKHHI